MKSTSTFVALLALVLSVAPSVVAQAPTGAPAAAAKAPAPRAQVFAALERTDLNNQQVFGWFKPSQKDVNSLAEAVLDRLKTQIAGVRGPGRHH